MVMNVILIAMIMIHAIKIQPMLLVMGNVLSIVTVLLIIKIVSQLSNHWIQQQHQQ